MEREVEKYRTQQYYDEPSQLRRQKLLSATSERLVSMANVVFRPLQTFRQLRSPAEVRTSSGVGEENFVDTQDDIK